MKSSADRALQAARCLAIALIGVQVLADAVQASVKVPRPAVVRIPGAKGAIGLDDMLFTQGLGLIIVPAGRTGKIDFISPVARKIFSISGFPAAPGLSAAHGSGPTSVDEGFGFLFATDRTNRKLYAINPKTLVRIVSASLAAGPDYVRVAAPTREVWVTEPAAHGIEIFSLNAGRGFTRLIRSGFIKIPEGGPEALVIDVKRGLAYTNVSGGMTAAIGIKSREIVSRWPNGCKHGEGLALDARRGFLIVACREGRAADLDLNRGGKIVSSIRSGRGIDIIACSPALGHAYLPGSASATMAFVAIARDGKLSLLGTVKTDRGAHCVAADNRGGAWVCDPRRGRMMVFQDPYPAVP
ncbi:MAG: YncE family protein [Elusimicrobiota bacterium]